MKADFPDRALVLVRSAVPPQPVGPAAPGAGRRLADRFPARLGRRSGRGEEAGAGDPAHPGAARQGDGFHLRVGQRLLLCRMRMDKFRHGRVIFAGDSARVCRRSEPRRQQRRAGCRQSGLEAPVRAGGQAPDTLLDSYGAEREYAADENILNSTRSTDFITPKSEISRVFRDATLQLAKEHSFARRLVNSGRPSVPASCGTSSQHAGYGRVCRRHGCRVLPAPTRRFGFTATTAGSWSHVGGDFTGVYFAAHGAAPGRCACRLWRRQAGRQAGGRRAAGMSGISYPGSMSSRTARACWRRGSTRGRAPSTCCGLTSMSAPAGAISIQPRSAAPSPARPAIFERAGGP